MLMRHWASSQFIEDIGHIRCSAVDSNAGSLHSKQYSCSIYFIMEHKEIC